MVFIAVSRSEVEALRELYDKLSNELHHDGLIHKDELAWALFKAHRRNLFVDRVFELFDIKKNNVIEFGEFVRSLSVFHPSASLQEKANCELSELHRLPTALIIQLFVMSSEIVRILNVN